MEPVEQICENCSLYIKRNSTCGVNVLEDGEQYQLEVNAKDKCFWMELGIEINQIRIWTDGKNGYIES